MHRIGGLDLPGGGQVVIDGRYAYVGHMAPPHGTTIVDLADPANPVIASRVMLDDDRSHTHKVRVCGDLMVTNVERNRRHFYKRAARLPGLRSQLAAELGRQPSDAELGRALGVPPAAIAELALADTAEYRDGGFRVHDISDRRNPRLIAHCRTHGAGAHRFDLDGNYLYLSTEMEGYRGNILVIYDLADPERPREVSRWHLPGQHIAGGEVPDWSGEDNRLHHAMRVGEEMWAAVWHAGIRVIDVSDIARPRTIAAHNFHPPFPEPTHTVMPLAAPVGGRRIAIAIDEEHDHVPGQPHAFMWILDVTDLAGIVPVSTFTVGELSSPYSGRPGRFGAHQFRERLDGTLVYATWFSGGLRVIDVAEPGLPREIAHFIPEPRGGEPSPQSNDVDVDANGLICLIDRNRGLDILELDRT